MLFEKITFINSKILLLVISVLFTFKISAQNWTGNVNSNWNDPANWSSWPLTGADILIDPVNYTGASSSPVISGNSVFTPAGMIVQNGANLTIQANLTTTGRIELFTNGTIVTITAGTVFASGGGSQGRFIVSDGAKIIMNGGLLKANQRLIIELGGTFIFNNGTINTIQELAIGDGNALGSSLFEMNGGSLTMSLDMGFENEAGLYYPTFHMSAGTLTVAGGLTWLGEAPGAGTPKFIMSGGSGTIGGDIINDPATTVDLYMSLSGNANLAFNGAAVTLVNSTDSIKQSGNSLFTFSNTNAINNPGVYNADGGTIIFNGITSLQGSGSYKFNNVTINNAKTLSHISPTNVSVIGDFISNGNFNANLNTITFGGSSSQSIGGATSSAFYNLTINNSSPTGLTLNIPTTVTGSLLLNNGKLNTTEINLLTLTDNTIASSGSALSFVNGPLKKTGNDAFVFPIGKNNTWRRLAMTAPVSVASEFVGEYFDSSYSSITPYNSPLMAVTNLEYWKLDKFSTADNVQVDLTWEDAGASAISNCAQLSISHWNGTAWNYVPSNASGSCTGSGAGSIQSNAVLTDYGVLTFGFFGIVTSQNVTLCNGDSMSVGTNTYTTSGTYIEVLTAADLSDSTVITQLAILPANINNQSVNICNGSTFSIGANTYSTSGNYSDTLISALGCDSIVNTSLTIQGLIDLSVIQTGITLASHNNSATTYQWVDCSNSYLPVTGQTGQTFTAAVNGNYAVIISENSCSDTSACFSITTVAIAENVLENGIRIFPNPNNGEITIAFDYMSESYFRLMDLTGRIVLEKELSLLSTEISYQEQSSGIYFAEITRNNQVTRIKLIKN
ncbi:MAG TPA: T9SS type A sorting domain-containing protein [Bacteroidia bacterium]|jgi:hypothetical protein